MYSGILPIIKQAALDAVDSTQPVNVVFGKVISTSPLKVQISQKLTLGATNLVLAGSLKKTTIRVSDSGTTGSAEGHSHSFSMSDTITIDNSLKVGDSVILVRIQGGTRYLILDKAVNA